MLYWIEENGKHLAFDDALLYKVYQEEDGWTVENVLELVAYSGYKTAFEAMREADKEYAELCERQNAIIENEYEPFEALW